jgi:hypothetical protein
MDVRVDVDASDPLQMLDAVEVAPTLEWPPFLNRRLPGSSWNFGDDPHGLTVTR